MKVDCAIRYHMRIRRMRDMREWYINGVDGREVIMVMDLGKGLSVRWR